MLVKDMVKIYSPTGSEKKLVDFLIFWAEKNGFKAYKDEVGNFIAEKGKERSILLVGHVDTVPGEIPVKVENGNLYGRGSVDAKAALACFLEAAAAVKKEGTVIIGAVDEEGNSKGTRNILEKFNPQNIIVGEPSGWNNLTIGYKGRICLYYTNEKSKKHASNTEPNASEEAITFFNKLSNFRDSFNERKNLFEQLGVKLLSINSKNNDFVERVEMKISFRIPPEVNSRKIKNFVENIKGNASVRYSTYVPPVKVSRRNKLIQVCMRAIRSVGGDVTFKLKTGTSDMNILQECNVPMVTYGPGDSSLDHTAHEHLNLGEYKKAVEVVKRVLKKL